MNSIAGRVDVVAKSLDRRIAQLRMARGWKQRELARRLEISPYRLSRIERGSWPRPGELAALRRVFGLSLDELVLGETAPVLEGEAARLLKQLHEVAGPGDWEALILVLRHLGRGFRNAPREGGSE